MVAEALTTQLPAVLAALAVAVAELTVCRIRLVPAVLVAVAVAVLLTLLLVRVMAAVMAQLSFTGLRDINNEKSMARPNRNYS